MLTELGLRHGLWSRSAPAAVLARGLENTTFAVADYVVRLSHDHEATVREAALLGALAAATAIPTPRPVIHDARQGLLVYRKVPGAPLLHRRQRRAAGTTTALVQVLSALRALPVAQHLPVDHVSNEAWLDDALNHFRAAQPRLDPRRAAIIASFLNDPPPPTTTEVMPQHNDLGAEHILVDRRGTVSGVIDWTDAARSDPARDTGLLYRDLGEAVAFSVAHALDGPLTGDEQARIRFHARCKWLEDFHYAGDDPEGRAPYLANCLRTFDHTFGDAE